MIEVPELEKIELPVIRENRDPFSGKAPDMMTGLMIADFRAIWKDSSKTPEEKLELYRKAVKAHFGEDIEA